MMFPRIQLISLSFHGPNKEPAIVDFVPGLNVIYGASDTGKSFIVESIDFMLGAKGPLTDIPQAKGYEFILLAFSVSGDEFTISRSMSGGGFRLFEGVYSRTPPEGDGKELSETHSSSDPDNLSFFLLSKIELSNKRIKKNARNETQNLSFRNIARLSIVNEEEIIQKRSPLSDGNYTADTANTSVFRMLLSGVDDSELVAKLAKSPEEHKREAQIDLLDQLAKEADKKIKALSKSKKDLEEQEEKLEKSMSSKSEQLSVTEELYKDLSSKRRLQLKKLEYNQNRYAEVEILLSRFNLLKKHYSSDHERLEGIKEAGSLFAVLETDACPICGAGPEYHEKSSECIHDVEQTVRAAEAEIQKIEKRSEELSETIAALKSEARSLEGNRPKIQGRVQEISVELDSVVSPNLKGIRSSYKQLADQGANVREALGLFENLKDLQSRKHALEKSNEAKNQNASSNERALTPTLVDGFSKTVEALLKEWGFPNLDRVYFDLEAKDLVVSGKPRTSYGKGLRAITQAAFSIGLLDYCSSNEKAHPGFVVLDSPLLSYKEPENEDDDLSSTDLNGNFYRYLLGLGEGKQAIIVENTDPPSDVELGSRVVHFSGLVNEERFGLFPVPKSN